MNTSFGDRDPDLYTRSLRLSLRIPALPRYAGTARAALASFASSHSVSLAELENMMFALGEALANAIEHAQTTDQIEVRFAVDENTLIATVVDRGRGFAGAPRGVVPLPGVFDEAGRGFAIMQRCTDFFDVSSTPGDGTVVTLACRRAHQGIADRS